MSFVRRLSTRRLIGVAALALVLVTGGVAVAQSALSGRHAAARPARSTRRSSRPRPGPRPPASRPASPSRTR